MTKATTSSIYAAHELVLVTVSAQEEDAIQVLEQRDAPVVAVYLLLARADAGRFIKHGKRFQ
jgi:hypothetical protein